MRDINVMVEPGRVWSFDEMVPGTIALDGACPELRIDPETRRFSFDHHGGCVRLATAATCQQVLDALLLGLDPEGMTVLVNDFDADTVVSVWLLRNRGLARDPGSLVQVRRLVSAVGAADAHGPGYPSPDSRMLDHVHREVLLPLRSVDRESLGQKAAEILEACLERLQQWWDEGLEAERGHSVDGEACPVEDHGDWVLARPPGDGSPGQGGCLGLYERGYDRLVLCSRMEGSRYRYTLARRSDLVSGFPVASFYGPLNVEEEMARGHRLGAHQRWGGGSTIGGGPRDGSVLAPDVVARVIDRVIGQVDAGPATGDTAPGPV